MDGVAQLRELGFRGKQVEGVPVGNLEFRDLFGWRLDDAAAVAVGFTEAFWHRREG